jgi:hypothetical protein
VAPAVSATAINGRLQELIAVVRHSDVGKQKMQPSLLELT